MPETMIQRELDSLNVDLVPIGYRAEHRDGSTATTIVELNTGEPVIVLDTAYAVRGWYHGYIRAFHDERVRVQRAREATLA